MKRILIEVLFILFILLSLGYCQNQNEYFDNLSKYNIDDKSNKNINVPDNLYIKKSKLVTCWEPKEDTLLRIKGDLILQGGFDIPLFNLYLLARRNLSNSFTVGIDFGTVFINGLKLGVNAQKFLKPMDYMSPYFEINSGYIWGKSLFGEDIQGYDASLSFGFNWFSENGKNIDVFIGGRFMILKERSGLNYPFVGIRYGGKIF
jgi:hypothetical protein